LDLSAFVSVSAWKYQLSDPRISPKVRFGCTRSSIQVSFPSNSKRMTLSIEFWTWTLQGNRYVAIRERHCRIYCHGPKKISSSIPSLRNEQSPIFGICFVQRSGSRHVEFLFILHLYFIVRDALHGCIVRLALKLATQNSKTVLLTTFGSSERLVITESQSKATSYPLVLSTSHCTVPLPLVYIIRQSGFRVITMLQNSYFIFTFCKPQYKEIP